jgi:putative heme iron utilization protein
MMIENDKDAGGNFGQDRREAAAFDPVAESRHILRTTRVATLATLTQDGAPFASLTTIATAPDGSPILLLSRLAHHTRFMERDARCSLLLATGGRGDPLAHPRLTLVGTAARDIDAGARMRFLRRNPKAELYADFPDFSFWRMSVQHVHLNGGFARAADFAPQKLLLDTSVSGSLIAAENEILDHMNADHADTLARYAEHFCAARPGPWRASGIDPEGLDLICGDLCVRLPFSRSVDTAEQAHAILVEMARQARGTPA